MQNKAIHLRRGVNSKLVLVRPEIREIRKNLVNERDSSTTDDDNEIVENKNTIRIINKIIFILTNSIRRQLNYYFIKI